MLDALSHTQRLRILAVLARERVHVSELARRLDMSRPLVIMHLKRLENAKLVVGTVELSEDSKAMKFYVPTDFDIHLTPDTVLGAILAGGGDTVAAHGESTVSEQEEKDGRNT